MRILFAIAGLLSFTPAGAFPGAEITDIAGALVGAILLAYEIFAVRKLA
jgi:hypothetical protein